MMWWFLGWLLVLVFALCLCKLADEEEEDV